MIVNFFIVQIYKVEDMKPREHVACSSSHHMFQKSLFYNIDLQIPAQYSFP